MELCSWMSYTSQAVCTAISTRTSNHSQGSPLCPLNSALPSDPHHQRRSAAHRRHSVPRAQLGELHLHAAREQCEMMFCLLRTSFSKLCALAAREVRRSNAAWGCWIHTRAGVRMAARWTGSKRARFITCIVCSLLGEFDIVAIVSVHLQVLGQPMPEPRVFLRTQQYA